MRFLADAFCTVRYKTLLSSRTSERRSVACWHLQSKDVLELCGTWLSKSSSSEKKYVKDCQSTSRRTATCAARAALVTKTVWLRRRGESRTWGVTGLSAAEDCWEDCGEETVTKLTRMVAERPQPYGQWKQHKTAEVLDLRNILQAG